MIYASSSLAHLIEWQWGEKQIVLKGVGVELRQAGCRVQLLKSLGSGCVQMRGGFQTTRYWGSGVALRLIG